MSKLLSATLAAALLAAPFATAAQAATAATPRARHAAHPAKPTAHRAAPARGRDSGSAAVDALNDQALARARGTAQ